MSWSTSTTEANRAPGRAGRPPRRPRVVAFGFTGFAFLAAMMARFTRRYLVEGRSMLPAFHPGDRVLIETLSYRLRRPRRGEVVVLAQPGSAGRRDLKRIAAGPGERPPHGARPLGPDEWFVLGDNLAESTDSRQLGPVRRNDIIGRVWLKY